MVEPFFTVFTVFTVIIYELREAPVSTTPPLRPLAFPMICVRDRENREDRENLHGCLVLAFTVKNANREDGRRAISIRRLHPDRTRLDEGHTP